MLFFSPLGFWETVFNVIMAQVHSPLACNHTIQDRKSGFRTIAATVKHWHDKCFGIVAAFLSGGPLPIGRARDKGSQNMEVHMLETILVVLLILWALGFFAFHVGGLVHVLLVIAVVVLIIRLLQGRKIF